MNDEVVEHFQFGKRFRGTVGRNYPCPCGSGKKFKRCCLAAEPSETVNRRPEDHRLSPFAEKRMKEQAEQEQAQAEGGIAKLPTIEIYWDAEGQNVNVRWENKDFRNAGFVLMVLEGAKDAVRDLAKMQQLAAMQQAAQQQAQAQAIAAKVASRRIRA